MTDKSKSKPKHPGGRPTDYRPEYCEDIIEFFSRPLTKVLKKTRTLKDGTVLEEEVEVANELPTLEEYCNHLGIVRQTLLNWATAHREFLEALTRAKQLEKDFIVKNSFAGRADSKFSIFYTPNVTDLRNRQEHTGADGGPILIASPRTQDEEQRYLRYKEMVEMELANRKALPDPNVIDVEATDVQGPGGPETGKAGLGTEKEG